MLVSPGQIDKWKREAKRMRREQGCSHGQALERIARREGYMSWGALVQEASAEAGK